MSTTPGQLFYSALARLEGECYLVERGECDGRHHAHHIYPKQLLKSLAKRLGVPAAILIADARNGIFLCDRHHHRVHHGFEVFDRADMPLRLSAFEVSYPLLEAFWPRIYKRRRALASEETGNLSPYERDNDDSGPPPRRNA